MSDPERRAAAVDGEVLKGYRVLVVDDEEDIREFLLAVLADAGAEICEAADGSEAIRVAHQRLPDLITLDLSMPGHDGIDAFCALRRDPDLAEIPVCIVTGHPEMRALMYERPMAAPEGFLYKPINPQTLVATIRRILALKMRKVVRRLVES